VYQFQFKRRFKHPNAQTELSPYRSQRSSRPSGRAGAHYRLQEATALAVSSAAFWVTGGATLLGQHLKRGGTKQLQLSLRTNVDGFATRSGSLVHVDLTNCFGGRSSPISTDLADPVLGQAIYLS